MAHTPYAVAADVIARWIGEDADDLDPNQVTLYLTDVTEKIDYEFPDLASRIYDSEAPPDPIPSGAVTSGAVKAVVCQVVIRKFTNPRGYRTEGTGPFSGTFGGDQLGQLVLTDDERAILSGIPTHGTSQAAFTISTEPKGAGTAAAGWIGSNPLDIGGQECEPGWLCQ